jgi:hypothetical protein
MRTIKIEDTKVTMKPINGEMGLTEIWTRYRPIEGGDNIQFIICGGLSYYLTTVKQ